MAQVSTLKSAQITALDTYQPGGDLQDAGYGAPARIKSNDAYVTPLAADEVTSVYRMVRVPTFAAIKSVVGSSQAQGAGAVDISVFYSDSTIDGTSVANQGVIVPTTGQAFFASEINIADDVQPTNYTFANDTNAGSNNQSLSNKPLWAALGLASDPGGWFDICYVVRGTAITTGTGFLWLRVEWNE